MSIVIEEFKNRNLLLKRYIIKQTLILEYFKCLQKGIESMMTLLTEHVSHMKKEDLSSHLVQLQGFYLTCLDIQSQSEVNLTHLSGCTVGILGKSSSSPVWMYSNNLG